VRLAANRGLVAGRPEGNWYFQLEDAPAASTTDRATEVKLLCEVCLAAWAIYAHHGSPLPRGVTLGPSRAPDGVRDITIVGPEKKDSATKYQPASLCNRNDAAVGTKVPARLGGGQPGHLGGLLEPEDLPHLLLDADGVGGKDAEPVGQQVKAVLLAALSPEVTCQLLELLAHHPESRAASTLSLAHGAASVASDRPLRSRVSPGDYGGDGLNLPLGYHGLDSRR
jgi:hypothetical protein